MLKALKLGTEFKKGAKKCRSDKEVVKKRAQGEMSLCSVNSDKACLGAVSRVW